MTLHDELRELVENFGPELLRDPEQFRAALDDYVDEGTAFPGQLNLLHDAVRFGALARCQEMLARGGDPAAVIEMAGDGLARERGSLEVGSARWAVATLAHATGTVGRSTLELFLGSQPAATPTLPDPPAWPTLNSSPPEPATPPTAMPTGPPPSSPPPTSPPPTAPPPSVPSPPSYSTGSVPAPTSLPSSVPSPPPPPPTATAPEQPPSQPVTAAAHPADPTLSGSAAPPPSLPSDGETFTAPPRSPTPPPPSGTASPPGRSRRKPVVAGVAAAVIVALIGTAAYAALGGSDDPDDTAKDPASSAPTDESLSPSASETTEEPPVLVPPAKPQLSAEQSYRSVIFTVSGPVVDEDGVELEALIDGGWTTTRPRFRLTTEQGGQKQCAEVRAVRVDGEARAPGPSQRLCEESRPRTIRLVKSATTCAPVNGYACFTYDLQVAGFAPRSRPTMEIVVCSSRCIKTVKVDDAGRGLLKQAVYGYAGTRITVKVGRLTSSVTLS